MVFPVHPRTLTRIESLGSATTHLKRAEPLGHLDSLALVSTALAVLTDTGGDDGARPALHHHPQENCARVTISEGTNVLADTNPYRIVRVTGTALASGAEPRCPALWNGHAADRIAYAIGGHEHPRPLDHEQLPPLEP